MERERKESIMPLVVIIDLSDDVKSFNTVIKSMKVKTCIDETLSRIMAKISEDSAADIGLQELKDDIVNEHRREGADLEGELYARAAVNLGKRVLHEVRQSQLYLENGFLNYYFHCWLRETTIILHEGSPVEIGGGANELAD